MLAALASALVAREPSTAAHATRVTFLAERLAAWLDWDDRRLHALLVGASLHDIGKVVERCAGAQFDPAIAEAFLTAWDAGALARDGVEISAIANEARRAGG
jgi:response regulator RpfG family c-di-GMP phosphodiesterase